MGSKDDKKTSLDQLQQHGASVISQLVDIGAKPHQERHRKLREFVTELCCLQPESAPQAKSLRRTSINAFKKRQYVALSYTWNPSKYENGSNKGFNVESWDSPSFTPSSVRNCVFDRVLGYMRHHKVERLWIDRHCIRQEACRGGPDSGSCSPSHTGCAQKRDALQAMDLVYQLSKHPVALLGRPMKDASELRLLHRVLSGDLVDSDQGSNDAVPRLSHETSISDATRALSLLHEITQDDWWTRAWTFQENYRGGVKMHLLMCHPTSLEDVKLQLYEEKRTDVLGNVPGELRVNSVTFSEQATLLCQALCRGVAGHLTPSQRGQILDVERATGRYQLLLSKSSSLTPRVLADVECRELSRPWDRLAIVANCCWYPIRLDEEALIQQDHSLSLSLLAMCLLNGEILDNGDDNDAAVSVGGLTASEFLEKLMFKKFQAPENKPRHFTFNRGCRLTYVELTASGVAARGHLWELGPTIKTADFSPTLPFIKDPNGFLARKERRLLVQLILHLRNTSHFELARILDEYLESDNRAFDSKDKLLTFTQEHLLTMAQELAAAIRARRDLRLGRIWYPESSRSDYSAVFVLPDQSQKCDGQGNPRIEPSFVFTSIRSGDYNSPTIIAHDTNSHASLGVDIEGFEAKDGAPKLRIRGWLLGMCFFTGCPLVSVVFPWPKALLKGSTLS